MKNTENNYPLIDMKETGKKIALLMKVKHISIKQLQEYLGLSCVQSIYRWLEGINLPSLDNLYAMSCFFQVPMDTIICGNRLQFERDFTNKQYSRIMIYYNKVYKLLVA